MATRYMTKAESAAFKAELDALHAERRAAAEARAEAFRKEWAERLERGVGRGPILPSIRR